MRIGTEELYRERLVELVEIVFRHLDEEISVVWLADRAGFSRYHFGRLFQRLMSESLSDFVSRLRMERAAWQLTHHDLSVGEVALDAGYGSPEAFARAFRNWYRVTPSEFRNHGQLRSELTAPNGVHWRADERWREPILIVHGKIKMEIQIKNRNSAVYVGLAHKGPYHTIGQTLGK